MEWMFYVGCFTNSEIRRFKQWLWGGLEVFDTMDHEQLNWFVLIVEEEKKWFISESV